MVNTPRAKERDNNPLPPSPTSNGGGCQIIQSPRPISGRAEPNPYPTTFVQADTSNFKQVVQMLTGSASDTAGRQQPTNPKPDPTGSKGFAHPPVQKKQGFKLYERRNSLKSGLVISPLASSTGLWQGGSSGGFSPRIPPEILSPSLLDFPKLALSPVTPLTDREDPFNRSPSIGSGSSSEEDKAIAEKGFYLHPSPMSTPRESEPQLLPLFPVSSPRQGGPPNCV